MWWRSWASRRPSTGTAATITNPTVMAVRCIARSSLVRPRGARSNTIAPPCIRGAWKVKSPSTSPRNVFGTVQKNPRQLDRAHAWDATAGGEGARRLEGERSAASAGVSWPRHGRPVASERRRAPRDPPDRHGARRAFPPGRSRALPGRRGGPGPAARPRATGDLDFATDAAPAGDHEGPPRLGRTPVPGRREVRHGGRPQGRIRSLEITTFREEVYAEEHRKPAVTFGKDLRTDLSRRDFTVNAMAVRLPEGEFVDPFGGVKDLAAKRLDTPLDPEIAFSDDPLRMLRAARFAAQLELDPDPARGPGDRADARPPRDRLRRADQR